MVQPAKPSPTNSTKGAESPLMRIIKGTVAIAVLGFVAWYIYQQMFTEQWPFETPDRVLATNAHEISAEQLLGLKFTNDQGAPVSLRELVGKKHQVIVFTRGSLASVSYWNKGKTKEGLVNVCPYCTSQVSGLAAVADQFHEAGAEVLVVFPVSKAAEAKDAEPIRAINTPNQVPVFPLWLDLDLKAVDALAIRAHLARPSSFILDKAGQLRFSYVGSNADRPSGNELLRQVRELGKEFPVEPVTPEPALEPSGAAPEVPATK
ncbi:AhpC/TSA family protein [Anatilimnocola aggregata]|uniref:AhpC/TSA family protein n=1 Tax=Anatilimnocola aggregata TaxID=2528021 RepID=A0A517YBD4_9BACT|nr:redoxin domain-containing protein [Anatilimnocola aggregata]QDU27547.1 AhpC/TSA family protein [Anatilimnocola aggregata]